MTFLRDMLVWTTAYMELAPSVVDRHRYHMVAMFGVFVVEDHSKLPRLYWLCTTTELSILLTSDSMMVPT